MIYYFSGTGNSYAVAKKLAEALGEELTDIAEAVKAGNYKHTMLQGERLGFVFPVYAWAPPQTVTDFVKNLELYYSGDPYLFAVCTCGSSAGETIDLLGFYVAPYGWVFADLSFGGSAWRAGEIERWNYYFGNLDVFPICASGKSRQNA